MLFKILTQNECLDKEQVQVFLILRREAILTNAQAIQSVKRRERGGGRRKSDTLAQHNCGMLKKQPQKAWINTKDGRK